MLVPGVVLYIDPSLGFIPAVFLSFQKKNNKSRIRLRPVTQAVRVGHLQRSFEKDVIGGVGSLNFMRRVRLLYLI